eukprot:CCRYP_017646-RA/>CCRYP_017646-RA protein AED:0.38 eAED:0.38 QI:40/1/1/1/1/0.5/2/0/492
MVLVRDNLNDSTQRVIRHYHHGHTNNMHSKITKLTIYFALASSAQHTKTRAMTLSPTTKPTGTQMATYDEKFGAPLCQKVGSECNSLGLLTGVDGSEPNSPNTIDECHDYSIGTYHVDESIEQMIVRSVSGGTMAMGTQVEVTALVYTATNTSNRAEPNERDVGVFFYAPDAHNITWKYKFVKLLWPGSGIQTLTTRFTLELGSSSQAVRLTYGYAEYAIDPCYRRRYWQDIDDLVFTVDYGEFPRPSSQPSASIEPSNSPSTIPTTSTNPTSSPTTKSNSLLVAVYNTSLHAPHCSNIGSSCSSGLLLDGSGSLAEDSRRESNAPNTIDDCKGDQETTTSSTINPIYHHDETIDKIVIRSLDEAPFRIGNEAELEVTVWSAQDTATRNNPNKWSVAHMYYAPAVAANNVTWKYIWSEVVASSQGEHKFTTRFNLESDLSLNDSSSATVTQAVRVSYAYAQYKPNQCPENIGYTDVDDLVFDVLFTQPTTAP